MKRNLFTHKLILILLFVFSFTPIISQELQTDLKVMTYNIWNGFDWDKDTIRKENWIKWIREKNPDVLALQELCGYNEKKLKADAEKWGHNYVLILKEDGYPVALSSKKPIKLKKRAIKKLWHGILHCETYGIDFFVVHLSPVDCSFRHKEANIITKMVERSKNAKYIILGDFNAHSPFDEELLKNNKSLIKKYSKKEPENKYSNLRLGKIDYSVISKFIAIPSIDISLDFVDIADRFTFPTPELIGSYRKNMDELIQTRERIDYILTSPILSKSCTNVTIFNKGEAETFSDHYPVMAEFNIEY